MLIYEGDNTLCSFLVRSVFGKFLSEVRFLSCSFEYQEKECYYQPGKAVECLEVQNDTQQQYQYSEIHWVSDKAVYTRGLKNRVIPWNGIRCHILTKTDKYKSE